MRRLLYITLPLMYAILLLMTISSPLTAAEQQPTYVRSSYHARSFQKVNSQPARQQTDYNRSNVSHTPSSANLVIFRQSDAQTRSYGQSGVFLPSATINSTAPMHLYSSVSLSTQLAPIGAATPHIINESSAQSDNTQSMRRVEDNPNIPFPDPVGDIPIPLVFLLILAFTATKAVKYQRV